MLKPLLLLPVSLLLCTDLAAQAVTSPGGLNAIEGNQVFFHFGGNRRFQQVDYSHAGTPLVITSISWRRNGNVAQTAPARTMDLTIDMGHTNFGALSHVLDDNFTASRTNVFAQTAVSFPDWSANVGAPGPYDFTAPLSAPFVYIGLDALVIDFSHSNTTVTGIIQVDRDFNGPITPPAGSVLGVGCVATGMNAAFSHTAYLADQANTPTPAYGIRLRLGATNAPASTPVLAFLDYQDQNLGGVLCSTLHALPLILITMNSQASGAVPDVNYQFTHDASLIGGTFFTQLLAVDIGQPGIPLVVSNARQLTLTATAVTNQHRCSYGWYALPGAGVATHFIGGGMVLLLQ